MENEMSEPEMEYDFIIDLIAGGECDSIIEGLGDAVRARREFLQEIRGAENRINFGPGTKVRIINIRPKYLHGVTGVVSAATPKRHGDIMVDVDPSQYYKLGHRYGHTLGVPASSLEEIQ
jgi:hypothetical protein